MSIFGDLFIFSPRVIQDNAGFERRDGRKIVSRIGEIATFPMEARNSRQNGMAPGRRGKHRPKRKPTIRRRQ